MFEKYVLSPILNSLINFSECNSFFIGERFYSYEDLAKTISKIRLAIQNTTFKGRFIGLITNDDVETYGSIIAIWMEGYAYVPIHPHHPIERGYEIINQVKVDLIIDSSAIPIYKSSHIIESKNLSFLEMNLTLNKIKDSETAYILFTSGSTGKPKGVPITRGNLGSFMKAFWEAGFNVDENDRCLQCFDLTFDVSIQCFLVPLSRGACTYTIPHDQIKYSYASELLEDHRLTFSVMAPSMVRFYKPYFEEINLPDMRYCILTAEASPLKLIEEWSECIPDAEIYDFYGPTEATIYCTFSRFSRDKSNKELNGMLSIGKPLNGMKVIVLDERGNSLQPNNKGELCVAGPQITPGYWNNPEKNKVSFFEKEINGSKYRFYRTGDSCYIDNEGDIMCYGRLDSQVKIQGFRIELGEIEYHAREHLKGKNVIAVTYENNTSGNYEIALFIEGKLTDEKDILEYLKSKLPYYMIPSKIIQKSVFPLNKSDKVDRISLTKSIKT